MLKIGFLVCAHGNLRTVQKLCKVYVRNKVDAIVLNGDLNNDEQPKKSMFCVLTVLARTKLPVYVMPGSHEPVNDYGFVLKKLKKYKNLIDCTQKQLFTVHGIDLVFLPGSDWLGGQGGFQILSTKKDVSARVQQLKRAGVVRALQFFFMNQLLKKVRNPQKTLVISHVPPKFTTPAAIDVAEYCVNYKAFFLQPRHAFKMGVLPQHWKADPFAKSHLFTRNQYVLLKNWGYPVKLRRENRGNSELAKLLKKYKIKHFVCGHFHESGHKACDRKGKLLEPNTWHKELFYNAAAATNGNGGIVIMDNERIQFQNVAIKS